MSFDIAMDWGEKMSPYAKPYFEAMATLDCPKQAYYADSGVSIVLYFLSNAAGWRGEVAKRIKQELKDMVKGL